MALRHDGPITAQDEADWRLIAQLAADALAALTVAAADMRRIYEGYGDVFGPLYRVSAILPTLARDAGTMRGIEQVARTRAHACRVEQVRQQLTPLWLVRPNDTPM